MATQQQPKYWTYDDLFDLPDDRRYEIIDGVLYEMPGPNMVHGRLISNLLLRVLWPVVEPLGGSLYTARSMFFSQMRTLCNRTVSCRCQSNCPMRRLAVSRVHPR